MKVSSFRYLLKEGVRNVWNNRVMSFTSVGVLTTCLLIVGAAYLITVNVNSMVGYIENQSEMAVFLHEVLPEEREQQRIDAETAMKSIDNIKSYVFVSKEQGLENTRAQFADKAYLLDGFEERNTIPDSFIIKIKDLSRTKETVQQLQAASQIEIVMASNDVADTLTYIQKTINTFGSALIIALAVISLVIISNTIRATIFTRRKEINIMKYVGATNNFIRIPFIVEGFMLGLISSLIAFLAIWGGYSYLISAFTEGSTMWLQSVFESVIPFKSIAYDLAIFFGATGTVLGMLGSAISVRNHARV